MTVLIQLMTKSKLANWKYNIRFEIKKDWVKAVNIRRLITATRQDSWHINLPLTFLYPETRQKCVAKNTSDLK